MLKPQNSTEPGLCRLELHKQSLAYYRLLNSILSEEGETWLYTMHFFFSL